MEYVPTIGLEIHAELATHTKMFCSCVNDPDEVSHNSNICPICLAHPGTLPVPNKKAIEYVLRVGSALGSVLATEYSEFDRKSYFYPDIPKGYQISQYEYPLVSGGELAGVAITRVHLEEDTARSIHTGGKSIVDFNRAGVPLMELVTEPDIHDAQTAGKFARELQLLLRTLGVSKANLEKGEMRIEANISVSKDSTLGTKVEVKNLNSFRSVERAIAFEIVRQEKVLEESGEIFQETRGWNDGKQETFHQRFKENSADYRYFPEPDIPKIILEEVVELTPSAIAKTLPMLPDERRARYSSLYALKGDDAAFLMDSSVRIDFFDAVAKELGNDKDLVLRATNYIVSDLAGWYAKHGGKEYERINPASFAELIRMTAQKHISSRGTKDILMIMAEKGGDPETIARTQNLLQVQDSKLLTEIVKTVIEKHQSVAEEYRAGKKQVIQFLIGQCMKESSGSGDPASFKDILVQELSK